MKEIKSVGIIGLGLLGGSLGLALKGKNFVRYGWARNEKIRDDAQKTGAIDHACATVEELLQKSDLVVLALPIPAIREYLKKYAANFRKDSIITDIGSIKGAIMDDAEKFLPDNGSAFIGSHPMAGTEKSGFQAAFPALYENAECFITPGNESEAQKVELLRKFWQSVGMKVTLLSPEVHDRLVGRTSHLVHLLAMALSSEVLSCSDEKEKSLLYAGCATGFRDTSRIASSSPKMWREIIENNQKAVLEAMDDFEKRWLEVKKIIRDGEFDHFEQMFADGKKLRDDWMAYKRSSGRW